MMTILRPMGSSDSLAVSALYASELPQCPGLSETILYEPSVYTLVACDGPRVIGAVSVARCDGEWRPGAAAGDDAEVLACVVSPDRRREGVGRALMTAAHTFARTTGASRISAQVLESPGAIHALLGELGWAPVGVEAQTYHDGRRAVRVSAEIGG